MQRNREAWVLDASVMVKWYLRDEDLLAQADYLRNLSTNSDVTITAPHLSRHEVANSLASACREGRVTWDTAMTSFDNFAVSGVSLDADPDWLLKAAASHAIDFSIAIYDAVYMALAEGTGGPFVTADGRLHRLVRDKLPFVRWLGDI